MLDQIIIDKINRKNNETISSDEWIKIQQYIDNIDLSILLSLPKDKNEPSISTQFLFCIFYKAKTDEMNSICEKTIKKLKDHFFDRITLYHKNQFTNDFTRRYIDRFFPSDTMIPPAHLTSKSKKIGQGTYSTVYSLTLTENTIEKSMAIKWPLDLEHEADVLIEFYKLKQLYHPNIILALYLVITPYHMGFSMEYMNQGSLHAFLRHNKNISKEWQILIALEITKGVEYLHDKKVVHRDLKPANILLNLDNNRLTVKVSDFGTSARFNPENEFKPLVSQFLATTYHYCAYELIQQYMNREYPGNYLEEGEIPVEFDGYYYGPETDKFSLGMIFFELSTKQKHQSTKYTDLVLEEMYTNWDNDRKTDLKTLDAFGLPALKPVVTQCWAKYPKQRLSNLKSIRATLEESLRAISAPPPQPLASAAPT